MAEITLTEKQVRYFANLAAQKQQLEREYLKVSEKEDAAVMLISETSEIAISPTDKIELNIKENKLVITPAPQVLPDEAKDE
jgi:DNA-binding MarR family transcriptional regulator